MSPARPSLSGEVPATTPTARDEFVNALSKDDDALAKQLRDYVLGEAAKDWQITHGSLLKVIDFDRQDDDLEGARARAVPISLVPTPWPKRLFDQALRLQKTFQELYVRLANDDKVLETMLSSQMKSDAFVKLLWDIHLEAKERGVVQPLSLGVFRSDYMCHRVEAPTLDSELKQVEFNTMSCSGGVHANVVADMHRHLHRTGMYDDCFGDALLPPPSLPKNTAVDGIVRGLVDAHSAYGPPKAVSSRRTGILIIVQHSNFNVADERPFEYALWDQDPSISTYRLEFHAIMQHVALGPNRELLYSSPACPFSPLEIAVVYWRAGYHPAEYAHASEGARARLMIEMSMAIKAPSILSHLTTTKKVQQELVRPHCLERFLSKEDANAIEATFMPQYPLDGSESGLQGQAIACDPSVAPSYVLKPSLEGGGNNVYGVEIPQHLKDVPREQWNNYVLQRRIDSPSQNGLLLSDDGLYTGTTISELGIFGVCLWKSLDKRVEIICNEQVGWTFKTKPEDVPEMSVVKGYGFFDSPHLVDDEAV